MVSKNAQPKTFGQYIRDRRLAAGLSLRDVADAIGVSHVFLGEVERGIRPAMKQERWERLAEAIPGVSTAELQRIVLAEQPLQLHLSDAPPQYQDLGLALARRIERRDLRQVELDELRRILRGGDADE